MADIDTTQNPIQPQTETYPPGSAIPIDPVTGQPVPPDESNQYQEQPEPAPEPEPEKPKPKSHKKKVASRKKKIERSPKEVDKLMATYPFKSKKPKMPRAGATHHRAGPKLKRASAGHHKGHRSSMSHHALKGSYRKHY
jgi:hypothetical protein